MILNMETKNYYYYYKSRPWFPKLWKGVHAEEPVERSSYSEEIRNIIEVRNSNS